MIFVRTNCADGCADIGCAVVIVVPQKVSGHADPARGMAGRLIIKIGSSKETDELLDSNLVAVDRVLCSRRDFANDRSGVPRSRRMIKWSFEYLEVPIVKVDAAAVGRFGRTAIGQDEITAERDDLFFQDHELLLLRRVQIFAVFAFCLRLKVGAALQKSRRVQVHYRWSDIGRGAILETIALDAIRSLGVAFETVETIPALEIDLFKLAIAGDLKCRARRDQTEN